MEEVATQAVCGLVSMASTAGARSVDTVQVPEYIGRVPNHDR